MNHKEIYESGETVEATEEQKSQENYIKTSNMVGDAVWEISSKGIGTNSWFTDYSVYPQGVKVYFIRGGTYYAKGFIGIYCFSGQTGGAYSNVSFRPVLSVF